MIMIEFQNLNTFTVVQVFQPFHFTIFFINEIINEHYLDSLVRYFISYKKMADIKTLEGNGPVGIDYNYFKIQEFKNEFILMVPSYMRDHNIHDNFEEQQIKLSKINLNEFLFIHYNILNNFKLMQDLINRDEFFKEKINKEVVNNLYKFLIKYYILLFNLNKNDFKSRTLEGTFKKMKKYCDEKFKSDLLSDIRDITQKEELYSKYKNKIVD